MKYSLIIIILGFLTHCQLFEDVKQTPQINYISNCSKDVIGHFQNISEILDTKEGFISDSTYQVVITSMKQERLESKEEAEVVSRNTLFNRLSKETKSPLSTDGKIDLKIFIEENLKLIKESNQLDGKYYYLYQIHRPALKLIVKEKLK